MSLTPEQFARLERLLADAMKLSPSLRAGLLAKVREQEGTELADQLQVLVDARSHSTEPISQPPIPPDNLVAAERAAFKDGELILNRFRIIRMLGRGGMGEVYEVEDSEMGRVALKTVRDDVRSDRSLRRFKQEVQLARMVTNPYVCRIHEFFTLPAIGGRAGMAFLTMELVDGVTLADRIAEQGPLPWPDVESIALQLCQGLQSIHTAGIIHRDFKSRNVMLTTHNGAPRAVVMDLGLAYRPEHDHTPGKDPVPLTLAGTIMGTPNYMAPEQFEGDAVTAATDIYAFGVVLYEMVTGRLPFEGSTPVAAAVSRGKRPPSASSIQPGVPPRCDMVIGRCLEYEQDRRFQSVQELAQALTDRPRRIQRFPTIARAGLALLALAVLGCGVVLWRSFHRYYSPPKVAMDWYDKGMESFREGTYLSATRLFQSALDKDKNFAMARARLSDAWNELDFKGNATEEMAAISSEQESGLTPAEHDYLEAVRATLRRDFQSAIRGFRRLIEELPLNEKAPGYVDLGRTYEKTGEIAPALASYGEAKKLAPDMPTAFLRSAVLESRQGSERQAAEDFDQAHQLYLKLGSLEGDAEVAYQQSYWQTILHHFKEARAYAQRSFDAARNMPAPSIQLEVRALCRFSAIDYGDRDDTQAINDALKAIALAHENGLEYWEMDALLRQGAGYFGKSDYAAAQSCFDRALKAAERNHWPRLIALAQVNLASLRDRLGQPQDVQGLGVALEYYKTYQFPVESFYPTIFLVREKNNQSQYASALQSAPEVLAISQKLGNAMAIAQAEEAVATSYFGLQAYPDALKHYKSALDTASRANYPEIVPYELAHCADVLVRLGRFEEAEETLRKSSARDLALEFSRIRARMFLSQGRYREAFQSARETLAANPKLDPFYAGDFRIVGALAASRSGLLFQAKPWITETLALAKSNGDPETEANAMLAETLLNLRANAPKAAMASAEPALKFFASHDQKESLWTGYYYLAQAESALNDKEAAKRSAAKSLDILGTFQHNWAVSDFEMYCKRPDVSAARQDLRRIAGL